MSRGWSIWLIFTGLLAAYCGLSELARRFPERGGSTHLITLEPGQTATVNVFTLVSSRVSVDLLYEDDSGGRHCSEDSGKRYQVYPNHEVTNGQGARAGSDGRYIKPDANFRLTIATPGNAPVQLNSLYCYGRIRYLSPNLDLEFGSVRDRLDTLVAIPLRLGWTSIQVVVRTVDPPLIGERARFLVLPEHGFHYGDPIYGWLVWGLFWPFFIPIIVIWFYIQVLYTM